MFYKVIKDNKVIDVLDQLNYMKYQPKHKIMVLSDENEAQAILSSDGNTVWHERTLYNIPTSEMHFETVDLIEIDEHEYKKLKTLNLSTPEEIIDEVILYLINNGMI